MEESKCHVCQGYGWWPWGDLVPIGKWDSQEFGKIIVKCPWCKAGYDVKGERYTFLKEAYERMQKEEKEKSKNGKRKKTNNKA